MFSIKKITLIFLLIVLQGCASSDISRSAASGIDMGVNNARNMVNDDGSLAEMYGNTSQKTKGAIVGGTAGAIGLGPQVGWLPGFAIGAIFGGALGAYIDEHTTLLDRLENRGAKIIILGDQVMIVLPSSRIFKGMTSEIRQAAYELLDMTALFISSLTKVTVKVAAYTNAIGTERINLALSQDQAQSIVRYFWARGLNTRLLVGRGFGSCNLIAPEDCECGAGDNYRIEITLEKLPSECGCE